MAGSRRPRLRCCAKMRPSLSEPGIRAAKTQPTAPSRIKIYATRIRHRPASPSHTDQVIPDNVHGVVSVYVRFPPYRRNRLDSSIATATTRRPRNPAASHKMAGQWPSASLPYSCQPTQSCTQAAAGIMLARPLLNRLDGSQNRGRVQQFHVLRHDERPSHNEEDAKHGRHVRPQAGFGKHRQKQTQARQELHDGRHRQHQGHVPASGCKPPVIMPNNQTTPNAATNNRRLTKPPNHFADKTSPRVTGRANRPSSVSFSRSRVTALTA